MRCLVGPRDYTLSPHRTVRETLASHGSCRRTKAATIRRTIGLLPAMPVGPRSTAMTRPFAPAPLYQRRDFSGSQGCANQFAADSRWQRRFAISAAIPLRVNFDAVSERLETKRCGTAHQARRLLAIAAIHDGLSRGEAAKISGMDRQALRDWVLRFNAEGTDQPLCNDPLTACATTASNASASMGFSRTAPMLLCPAAASSSGFCVPEMITTGVVQCEFCNSDKSSIPFMSGISKSSSMQSSF